MKKVIIVLIVAVVLFSVFDDDSKDKGSTDKGSTGEDTGISGCYFPPYPPGGTPILTTTPCPKCVNGKVTCPSCGGTGTAYSTIQYGPDYGFGSSSFTVDKTCKTCFGMKRINCAYCGGLGYVY